MKVQIRKILCPTDFSPNSEHALLYGIALASAYQAQLKLLHVVELPVIAAADYYTGMGFTPEEVGRFKEAAGEQLENRLKEIQKEYTNATCELASGTPFVEIIRVAKDDTSDLIVLGTHGRSGLAHMLIGSVAEKIVRKAPCPVLTVKHPEHEFVMP